MHSTHEWIAAERNHLGLLMFDKIECVEASTCSTVHVINLVFPLQKEEVPPLYTVNAETHCFMYTSCMYLPYK